MTSRTVILPDGTTGDSTTQTWDLRNRLAGATVTRGGIIIPLSYAYNDENIQVRRTENGTTRLFLLDPNNPTGYVQVIEEYSAGGVLLASFVYGREPLSQRQGGTVSHYLMDAIAACGCCSVPPQQSSTDTASMPTA